MIPSTDGIPHTISNVTVTGANNFNTQINTGNNTLVSIPGLYSLTAHYDNSTAHTTFDYYYTIEEEEEYIIPSYMILSDHTLDKWNRELNKWGHMQNITDDRTEILYDKLDRATSKNQTDKIELYKERIGNSMALSYLYGNLIEILEEQLDLLS